MALKSFLKRRSAEAGVGLIALTCGLALWGPSQLVRAQQNASSELEVIRIRPNFYMIAGAGGNIALQTGKDGTILVNAGSSDAADRVVAAIKNITDQPIRYIINTSADSDFVGGNARLARAGRNILATGPEPLGGEFERNMTSDYAASIFAAEPVLFSMSAPTGKKAPFPQDAWPVETFSERRRDMYFNGEGLQIYHEPAAHSDGDSVILFRASDVVVSGDVIDTTRFPVIDSAKGGSIQGEIDALNHVIELSVRPMPFVFQAGGTYIIPGHGRVCDRRDVVEYRDMIVTIRDIIGDMVQRGLTLTQVNNASPTKAYEREYGARSGQWTTDNFVEAVFKGVTRGGK
jgi:glyoxylase-like metal-dependent hydrolase (beta-lactamase superfamily II)